MSMKIKNVSIDLETWGKRPGCDIRSIGAYMFNPLDEIHVISPDNTFYIACENPLMGSYSSSLFSQNDLEFIGGVNRKYHLSRDPNTVRWWKDQSEDLKGAFSNPVDLGVALTMFSEFLFSISEDIRDGIIHDILIWSHGAAFDPNILEAAYVACGLTYPLFYRSPRDTRTVYDDAGIEDHSAHLKKHNSGPLHHALYDSISQAKAISEAKRLIHILNVKICETAIAHLKNIANPDVTRDSFAQREIAQNALDEIQRMKDLNYKELV